MCRYRQWQEGIRTFSDFAPGYAQGAYFPGDEPRYICAKTKENCGDPDGNMPECCNIQEDTGWPCPDCEANGRESPLRRNAKGIVSCEYGHAYGECPNGQPMRIDEL